MTGEDVDYSIPGLRIRTLPGDGLEVRSACRLEGWEPWSEVPHVISPTIHYNDRWYVIEEADASPDATVRYRLAPWPETRVVRRSVELEAFAWFEEREEEEQVERYRRWDSVGWIMELVTGWLPGRWQERFSLRYPTDPVRASFRNAVLFIPPGIFLLLAGAVQRNPSMMMIGGYLVAEGSLRLVLTFAHEEPLGWLPLEIGERLLHALLKA